MFILEFFLHYLLFVNIIECIETSLRILDKGILPLKKDSVAIQFYLDIENEDKLNSCKLRSRAKMCCLSDDEEIDCDIMKIYGDYYDVLKPKYRDTILYIYPTMAQHDKVGYCSFILEHRCGINKDKREIVIIPFDTRLKLKSQFLLRGYTNGQKITPCETLDQDSLNECSPVNCDIKYSGNRPFYDTTSNKCVKAVECLTDPKQELPDVVYVPKSNTCRDLNMPLTIADIYAISAGLTTIKKPPEREEIIWTLKSNCSTISQNLMFLRDLLYGKLFAIKLKTDFSSCCNAAILSILTCIVGLSLALLIFVLVCNGTAWVHKKWRSGEIKNEIQNFKKKIRSPNPNNCKKKMHKIDNEVKNKLLKEVIVSDLPLELRDSVVNICDQIDKEMRWKKMAIEDTGSKVHFKGSNTSDTSTTSDLDYEEKQRLLK